MSMNGIDISLWQKGLDLSTIKCDFVIIKATEGLTIVDPQFRNFVTQAKALNKPMGFYHFARPDKNTGFVCMRKALIIILLFPLLYVLSIIPCNVLRHYITVYI